MQRIQSSINTNTKTIYNYLSLLVLEPSYSSCVKCQEHINCKRRTKIVST